MRIVIAGAGLVGGELARRLLEQRHDVVVIEQDKEACDRIYAAVGVVAINGDASRVDVLREAEVPKADVLVAATGDDSQNLVCAILAKSIGVGHIIVRMRDESYESAYRLAGVDRVIRVTDVLVNQLIVEVEKPKVRRITTIGEGRADIYGIIVPQGAQIVGRSVREIAGDPTFPSNCIFIALYNTETEEFHIPRGDLVIEDGSELFVIAPGEEIRPAVEFLTA